MDAPPPTSVHMITYVYSENRIFYQGTISDLDGTPKSTWTLSKADHKVRLEQPIDQATFAFLWNGIARYGIFKKSLIQGADTPIDFYHFRIIGIAFRDKGQSHGGNYGIKPDETDVEFKEWFKRLNVPPAPSRLQ